MLRWILLSIGATGCSNPVDVDPEVPSTVPANQAPPVESAGGDPTPEDVLSIVCGEDRLTEEELDYNWCHGRAYVARPMLDVVVAALQPRVAVDFRNAEFTDVQEDVDPEAAWSVQIHHVARSDLADIEYDVRWVCDPVEGGAADPETVLCTFGMLEGQALFPYFEGSIALVSVEGSSGVLEWQYIEHLQAPTTDQEMIEQTLRDVYADMQAYLRGEEYPPLP